MGFDFKEEPQLYCKHLDTDDDAVLRPENLDDDDNDDDDDGDCRVPRTSNTNGYNVNVLINSIMQILLIVTRLVALAYTTSVLFNHQRASPAVAAAHLNISHAPKCQLGQPELTQVSDSDEDQLLRDLLSSVIMTVYW